MRIEPIEIEPTNPGEPDSGDGGIQCPACGSTWLSIENWELMELVSPREVCPHLRFIVQEEGDEVRYFNGFAEATLRTALQDAKVLAPDVADLTEKGLMSPDRWTRIDCSQVDVVLDWECSLNPWDTVHTWFGAQLEAGPRDNADFPTKSERKPINSLKSENEALSKLNEQIIKAAGPINIRCGRFVVESVTAARKAPSTAKADWLLTGASGASLFITHKREGFCHNGYGSVGAKAFPSRSPYHDPLIWAFARWARAYCAGKHEVEIKAGILHWLPGGTRGVWCIPPKPVQNRIVYGPEWKDGEASYGLQNCQIAAVGKPELKSEGQGCYRLTFSGGESCNGDVPSKDDEPILCIGSRVGLQQHIYLTAAKEGQQEGFAGWVGVFPMRIFKSHSPKGANLERIDWPENDLSSYLSRSSA